MSRAVRIAAQVALLMILLSTSLFLTLREYLDNDEQIYNEGNVSRVVERGPVTIENVEWTLESLRPYKHLVDKEGDKIQMEQPAGSILMVATLAVTPREGQQVDDDGFSCNAKLRDDKGNVWEDKSAFSYALPTYCGDDDHKWALNKTSKVAKIFVIPEKLAPGVLGVQVESFRERSRVLITP